ncbi:MAG: DUF2628 domain-containing protein [Pseudomonadota bacterium]
MAMFTVHLPPDGDISRARFIREGVNIIALVIPMLWLIWNRLWLELMAYITFLAAIAVFAMNGGEKLAPFLSALPGLYLFIEGNQFIRAKLERAGWLPDAVVDATTVPEAEIIYYGDGHQQSSAAVGRRSADPRERIGLSERPGRIEPSSIGMFPE